MIEIAEYTRRAAMTTLNTIRKGRRSK